MFRIICLLIGYAFGCIQNAYFAGRLVAKVDIREHGSGGAGMTNANRLLGSKVGALVFVADIFKAVAAFALATRLFDGAFWPGAGYAELVLPGLWAGLGVILGHDFPFFLKFKGGKGVASMLGLMLMLDWRIFLIIAVTSIVVVAVSRYISTASLWLTLIWPVLLGVFGYGWEVVVITTVLWLLAWYLHRGNIRRLLSGNERRFSIQKKGSLT